MTAYQADARHWKGIRTLSPALLYALKAITDSKGIGREEDPEDKAGQLEESMNRTGTIAIVGYVSTAEIGDKVDSAARGGTAPEPLM